MKRKLFSPLSIIMLISLGMPAAASWHQDDVIKTKKLKVKDKATICGDLEVKGNTKLHDTKVDGILDLAHAEVIEPGDKNIFHGYWLNVGASIGAFGFLELGGRFADVAG